MRLSIEEIKKNYSNFPNHEIEKIATEKVSSLSPEVIEILQAEIKKRNLNINLLKSITIQRETISEEKIAIFKKVIESANCPVCSSNKEALIAVKIIETISLIFITTTTERLFIGCPTCAKKERNNAIVKTALLGWWSPWGLFYYTPKSLLTSLINTKNIEKNSIVLLESFVVENIGRIQAAIDDKNELIHLLKKQNNNK